MPKVSVKEFQRRIAELDSQYTVAQPRRPRLFGSIFALIVLALIAVAVFVNIHRYPSDGFTQLTLKQGTTTPQHQLSDAETQRRPQPESKAARGDGHSRAAPSLPIHWRLHLC